MRLAAVLTAALALSIPAAAETENGGSEPSIPGFSPRGSTVQREIEEGLVDLLDPASTARHFRYLTEEPHAAGSQRNYELAEYMRDRFVEYGLEDVALLRYDVLLPLPRKVAVVMQEPYPYEPSLQEDGYPEDKDSYAPEVGPTYIGMSASGDVTGEVIYAYSGNPEDYDWLESQGIDPRGKIAVVRYSMPYSYRGFKAWEAQRRGVKALLIYSDPMEDGYRKGEVFPHGPWGPESHIQRGAITYDFIVPGDPLTPGWASVEGARRIDRAEARSVPGIVAVPLSWRDARPILEALAGPVAPHSWQGGLPITYHVGPGPAKLRVTVDMDDEIRPIWVVTGSIRGAEEPDQMVILGNHRDAWVYGAVDPSSGSATLLEEARILGALARDGHRPRRTVVLASWDAEEWHLTGSTEWGEQFAGELTEGGVAYLNVDSSVSGPDFEVSAVASLDPLVVSVARDVIDPNSRRSLLETWRRRTAASGTEPEEFNLVDNDLGSGSDYTVFLNYLGMPIVDMTFSGPYGVYHSQYDDHYWMTRFGDPGLRYMTAMVEVWGRMALRLANAAVIPYDLEHYASTVTGFVDALEQQPGVEAHLGLSGVRAALDEWIREADAMQSAARESLEAEVPLAHLGQLNDSLLRVERQFLLAEGIPGRPWFKHALYAPQYTYAAMSLPGIQEAVEAEDWELAREQSDELASRLRAVAETVRKAAVGLTEGGEKIATAGDSSADEQED
jgi:N-acetylated-alpha-linked acidic dipeptidase